MGQLEEFINRAKDSMREVKPIDTQWMQRMFIVYMTAGDPHEGSIRVCRQCDPSDIALQYSTVSRITALLDRKLLTHKKMKGWVHIMPVGVLVHEFVFEIASRHPVIDSDENTPCHFDVKEFVKVLMEAAEEFGAKPADFENISFPGVEPKRSLWWKFKRLFMLRTQPPKKKAGTNPNIRLVM